LSESTQPRGMCATNDPAFGELQPFWRLSKSRLKRWPRQRDQTNNNGAQYHGISHGHALDKGSHRAWPKTESRFILLLENLFPQLNHCRPSLYLSYVHRFPFLFLTNFHSRHLPLNGIYLRPFGFARRKGPRPVTLAWRKLGYRTGFCLSILSPTLLEY
jgi:hypothetical protein